MIARILLCFLCVTTMISAASAQTSPEQSKRAGEILDKLTKVEMLNLILPLVMTKEQVRAILPAIEKARANVKKVQQDEFNAMVALEKKADEHITKALEKGIMPSKEFLKEISDFTAKARNRQIMQIINNVSLVIEEMKKHLNEGQMKAATNTLNVQLYEPGITDPSKVSEELKLNTYVKWVLLDPVSYQILVEMAK